MLSKKLSIAALVGFLSSVGHMGAQTRLVERPGHGQKIDRKNVSRETQSWPNNDGKGLNKIQRKTGKYGGKDREEKMFKAGLKRDRKRASRLGWANDMCFAGRMVRMLAGFVDVKVADNVLARVRS